MQFRPFLSHASNGIFILWLIKPVFGNHSCMGKKSPNHVIFDW